MFNKTRFIYLLALVVFLTGLVILFWFRGNFLNVKKLMVLQTDTNITQEKIDCKFRRLLDGICVDSVEKVNPELVAVMIENHSEARPQSGLSEASVVYEAPVEANYTRFMLIFPADAKIDKVGPVRSARPYYLDWLQEYGGPMYMHVGGSPDALDKIKTGNIFDLNEFYNGKYYWRDNVRSAPHNVYTSSELWGKALEKEQGIRNKEQNNLVWWKFATTSENEIMKLSARQASQPRLPSPGTGGQVAGVAGGGNLSRSERDPAVTGEINEITVSFLSPVYEAVWKYNSSTNQYARYQMNKPHCDLSGACIVADTVIVQNVKTKVLDEVGRISMETVGKGEAEVFVNGGVIKGYWQKNSGTERTKFYDENNLEIKLNSGKIWIEVANQNSEVRYE